MREREFSSLLFLYFLGYHWCRDTWETSGSYIMVLYGFDMSFLCYTNWK